MRLSQLKTDKSVALPFSLSLRVGVEGHIDRIDSFGLVERLGRLHIRFVADGAFDPDECMCEEHRTLTISHIAKLVAKAAKQRFPNLPKDVLEATRKAVLKQLQESLQRADDPNVSSKRISCKFQFCQQGTRKRPKQRFYPHEIPTSPYCCEKCLNQQKERFAWYLMRRPSGGYRKLYKKDCSQCKRTFWHTQGRKRCEKCLKKPVRKKPAQKRKKPTQESKGKTT